MARPSSMHVDRHGDGRCRVQGVSETHALDYEGPQFDKDPVEKTLGKLLARAAAIGYDYLDRIASPQDTPSSQRHFSIDEDGTTVGKSDKPLLALPLGLEDLDRVESLLFQLAPGVPGNV